MKLDKLTLVLVVATVGLTIAQTTCSKAAGENCYSIRDADKRNACIAETRQPSACSSIRDSDARAYCQARAARRGR